MSQSEVLTPSAIEQAIIDAGLAPLPAGVPARFAAYAELLIKWNERLNLTALRSPGQILQRHFIECIFCAQHLAGSPATLLDYGSGAGFPGIPIALCRPELAVTLAESNLKKAAFLREASRVLGIEAEVYAGRVSNMDPAALYDTVTMRAVDKMQQAATDAVKRVKPGGRLALLTTSTSGGMVAIGMELESTIALPNSTDRVLVQLRRPR